MASSSLSNGEAPEPPDWPDPRNERAERQAWSELRSQVAKHLELASLGMFVVYRTLVGAPTGKVVEATRWRLVCLALFARLFNDGRAALILAQRGYSMQCGAIVSGLFENAYSVARIRDDEELAWRWIRHDNPKRSWYQVDKMVAEVWDLMPVANGQQEAKHEYRAYRQLCMAKHANPLVQMSHSVEQEGNEFVFGYGPSATEQSVRLTWFALEHMATCLGLAVNCVGPVLLPEPDVEEMREPIRALYDLRATLRAEAVTRWGKDDPLPGRW